ncbi:alpha/beta fold hydrolase (plasmid) [Streptomyces sp. GDS52]|uniref:alpha/beta fold hydrolase n=1 Tax=Streptomyces sp. GDS52 TaxID=3406419 RepID=UPI003FD3A97D
MGQDDGLGLIFVHGFKSSPAMWDDFANLLAADTGLADVTQMRFQYATRLVEPGPLRRIPTFDTVADSLKEFVSTEAEGIPRLVLVAHSQGGLVVQRFLVRMLAEGRGRQLERIRRVVLFACPNNGSQLGLALRRWTLRSNPQERQLRPLDEQITDTQRAVLRDIVNATKTTERTCPIPFSVYAGETDNVVTPASARSVFPDAGALPGDHFTIVRPDSIRHRSYTTLRRLLLDAADASPPAAPRASSASVDAAHGISVPVEACSPERLGIHPAIDGSRGDRPGARKYVLPAFVARPHDDETRERLDGIVTGTEVGFILLRGGSCTGKTRSAYEAIKAHLGGWQMVQPRAAEEALALISRPRFTSRTVLWLDDIHHLLEGPAGETVAAGLHHLLDVPGPAVILATIWPGPYRSLIDTPPTDKPDLHLQARRLLRRARLVHVPDEFSGASLTALHREALSDASLAMALATTKEPGAICQTLAAGPDLLDHWRHATNPYGKALITAAADARRFGHRLPLDAALLRDAAPGYLSATQRADADTDWFEQGISYALQPVKQVASALRPVPRATGMGAVPDVYDLADYLEQTVARDRCTAPTSFWDSAVTCEMAPQSLRALAQSAQDRALYKHAALFLHRCLRHTDDSDDFVALGDFLLGRGLHDDAGRYMAAAAARGNAHAMVALGGIAQDREDLEAALRWHRSAWTHGNERAFFTVYWLLKKDEREDEAESWIRLKAGEWPDAARLLADLLAQRGQEEEAEEILWPLARDNMRRCRRDLISLLYKAGRTDRIQVLFTPLAAAGDENAREWLDTVRTWDEPAELDPATTSDSSPSTMYVSRRGQSFFLTHDEEHPLAVAMRQAEEAEASGRPEEAVAALRGVAQSTTHWPLLQRLSGLLEHQGCADEALGVWRLMMEDGNPAALEESVNVLERNGDADKAEDLIRRELLRGPADEKPWAADPPGLELLVRRLTAAGRQAEAEGLKTYGILPDGTTAPPWRLPAVPQAATDGPPAP